MDTATLAGRSIVAGLTGPELRPADGRALADLAPAGLILFARNLRSAAQVADLIAGIRETAPAPLFLAIDQEGGPVNRLAGFDARLAALPDGRTQAAWDDERHVETFARVGAALAALGFDVAFAPVVDLDEGAGANGIGRRSFGADPGRVAACARRVLDGYARAGIAGCAKHYPGLGATELDTHLGLATCALPEAELWGRHVAPYRDLADGAPMVMTAHAHYPDIDGTEPLPATFSPRLIGGWLRERIGYRGLVLSDDLEMGALGAFGTPAERAVRALASGADLALYCRDLDEPRRARDLVAARVTRGDLDPARLVAAMTRLDALLARWPGGRRTGAPRGAAAYDAAVERLVGLL